MIYLKDYFEGNTKNITKDKELEFLKQNNCKNTGLLAEKYIANLLDSNNIKYKKNLHIKTEKSYIIPDFYIPESDIFLEIKSRSYNCNGTASEKIDHIPRKYSTVSSNDKYKHTKVLVVFCAYEVNNPICSELVLPTTEYSKDFVDNSKKYNILNWITVDKLVENLPKKVKPFIKWAGGKKKLSDKILDQFPTDYNSYYEPFIGGGAIGLSLQRDKKKYFSDINKKLIDTYTSIKNNCDEVIKELKKKEYTNNKESFLKIRTKFNEQNDSIITSAMFIYLNKCCFNGLYRENSSGGFNVPFGDMKNPIICDENLLQSVSSYLENVDIKCQNYSEIEPIENDLVYFDPPYHQTFSSYSKNGFSEKDQVSLKEFVDYLTSKKVKVILSNSNTEFIQKLYENYNKVVLDTKYSIGKNKSKIEEILITNFSLNKN